MKIKFNSSNPQEILNLINSQLCSRKLGNILSISMDKNTLNIVISKLGTSKLQFDINHCKADKSTEICLKNKKIAITHKTLEKEILRKFLDIIKNCGGEVIEPYS